MHMKTMLLPTGEFALIVDSANMSREEAEKHLPALWGFRKDIGAAGLFFSSEEVTVEDAFYDENATGVYPEPDEPEDDDELDDDDEEYPPSFSVDTDGTVTILDLGNWISIGTMTDEIINAAGGLTFATEDLPVIKAIEAGRETTPAGLVVGEEGDPTFSKEDLEAAVEPDEYPQVGDAVLLCGSSYYGCNDYVGQIGTVIQSPYHLAYDLRDSDPDAKYVLVDVALPSANGPWRLIMDVSRLEVQANG